MDYSDEQRERIFTGILSYVAKAVEEEGVQATITPKTIHRLTGIEMTEDYVIANRKGLNKEFGHLSSAYGFTDFHDFYLYAMSCEGEYEETTEKSTGGTGKSKNKDLSKLKKVKRTVMRNGKPTEMTFYEDPNKGSGDSNPVGGDEPEEEDDTPQPIDSKELQKVSIGEINTRVSTKDLQTIQEFHEAMEGEQPFYSDADSYTVLTDPNHNVMGIIGFEYSEEVVTLVFADSNPLVNNFDTRLFYELAKEGLRRGIGIRTKHLGTRTFDVIVEDFCIEIPETEDGYYELSMEDLFEVFGYDLK